MVEAYWLGNELLEGVDAAPLYHSLRERFAPRLSPKLLALVLGQVPVGAKPFHAFHVLDVYRRTGALAESLEVLDNCRINWGRVQSADAERINVQVEPICFEAGRLVLGMPETRSINRQVNGRGFVDAAGPGDWVSIH